MIANDVEVHLLECSVRYVLTRMIILIWSYLQHSLDFLLMVRISDKNVPDSFLLVHSSTL